MVPFRPLLEKTRLRGITLLETIMALAIGAVIITGGVQGINRYTEGVQVQASGSQLQRVIMAADTWADDRYETIQSQAPRVYTPAQTQNELRAYLGGILPKDAYNNTYRMVSRTYTYNVPDPVTGANQTRDAVQILIVGFNTNPGPLATEADIRINIANTAGKGAGFVSTNIATCDNGSGGRLGAGNICGAYGSYALGAGQFPGGALNNAFVVGLITKGDSSFYGDQLYRYNYGDPDLNTMRTALSMDSGDVNEIQSPRQPLTMRSTTGTGGEASVIIGRTTGGAAMQGDLVLNPGNSNRIVIDGNGSNPVLKSSTNVLLIGNEQTRSLTASGGATYTTTLGTDQVRANQMFSSLVGTNEVSNLWRRGDAPLRLQNFPRGEVIIGQRGRYSPRQEGQVVPGLNYELSDGRLVAGHVVSQDITCADCGGSLSEILPRWRHMGSYFVGYTRGAGTRVPHPQCTSNRRNRQVRNATSDNAAYRENNQDTRYRPAILLMPRQIRSKSVEDSVIPSSGSGWDDVPIDAHFTADQPLDGAGNTLPFWNVILHKQGDNVYSTALALTYCVFSGGDANATDPTDNLVPGMFDNTPTGMGSWTALP